jgi:hypothetical protein
MENILASLQRLLEAVTPWQWASIISLFVFLTIIGRAAYFFGFAGIAVFAWVIRDLGRSTPIESYHPWVLTGVIILGLLYALYVAHHHTTHSGSK